MLSILILKIVKWDLLKQSIGSIESSLEPESTYVHDIQRPHFGPNIKVIQSIFVL